MIATERNDARRIDRQLYGRCARQGDPGSVEAILSWQDEIIESWALGLIVRLTRRIDCGGRLKQWIGLALTGAAQRAQEHRDARVRKDLLAQDRRLKDVFAIGGLME